MLYSTVTTLLTDFSIQDARINYKSIFFGDTGSSGVTELHCIFVHLYKTFLLLFPSRSFAKPPPEVQRVCECIVVLKGIREVSWKSAKAMMAEANFLGSLTNMDVDGITVKQTQAVKGQYKITKQFSPCIIMVQSLSLQLI